jgi:nucleoside diphosphate kinase
MKKFLISILFSGVICSSLFCADVDTTNLSNLENFFAAYDEQEMQKFVHDPFFRASLEVFKDYVEDFESFFKNHTYLVIKPDGIVAGSFEKILNVLREYEFEVVGNDSFEYTPNSVKQCWYYESRQFPPEWCKLFEMVLTEKKSALLLLRDAKPDGISPSACERLAKLKGSAMESKRNELHIRTKIGAGSGLLAFIHVPDSPLSMIKELGIILSEKQCKQLLANRRKGHCALVRDDIKDFIQSVHGTVTTHDLNFEKSLERLRDYANGLEESVRLQFLRCLNEERLWKNLIRLIDDNKLSVPSWDLITFCVIGSRI